MIVRYDSLNRLEKPQFTLCNPGSVYTDGLLSNVVGILTDHEAEEIVFNFNATSELNIRVNKVPRIDDADNAYVYSIYRAIQNRRLIFVENVGFFMITDMKDNFDNGMHCKDIKAQSIEIEIAQKMIPFIPNNTYRFTSDETGTDKGILETVVETLPLWTIGYVDPSVAKRYRTFEDTDTSLNCLSFMLQNLQDAYECIFVFNNITRTINVYDQANYVRQTNIHITKEDLINSLDISENADDLYTAISVLGGDNVTISAINPIGTNTIYDFSYYTEWMTTSLKQKVLLWQQSVEDARSRYYELNLQYFQKLSEVADIEMEIERLASQIAMYSRCRENIVAESNTSIVHSYNAEILKHGGEPIELSQEISETLKHIDDLLAQCDSKHYNNTHTLGHMNEELSTIKMAIDGVRESLQISNYFTEDEYTELSNYIFEGSYSDEYVTITDIMTHEEQFEQMKVLYDRAKARLDRASKPTQEFSIDVENFIFDKEFSQWSEQLETGCLINVELDTNDVASLFLSNITINYDDRSLKMTFGNRFNKFDVKSLFDDVLGKISKSANTLGYLKEILYPIRSGEFNSMREALQTSRDLTMGAAISSANEEVIIDGAGYTGKKLLNDGSYDPHQVKLTCKNLVYTDDAWESCKVAIGELMFGNGNSVYGVNAELIVGDMIIGNNLRILDNNGNDLLTVVDGKIASSVGDMNNRLTSIEQTNESIVVNIRELQEKEIDSITTSTGYTFNADGLTIYRSGEEIKNLLDNTGMYVTRSDDEILTANSDGVNAINLSSRQYLIVGDNSRFENYSNGSDTNRTACFYISK